MRKLVVLLVILVLGAGAYVGAGFMAPPVIQIAKPDRFVGASTPVEINVDAPNGALSLLRLAFEQGGMTTSIIELAGAGTTALVSADAPNRVHLVRPVGRDTVPSLKSGTGKLIVTAERPVLFGLRTLQTVVTKDVEVRLEKPTVAVLSTHHYINLGGAEMILYKVSPNDVLSGVKVGDLEYPGYPAAGATVEGVSLTDPSMRIAFFALRWDQPLNTQMSLYARDEAGNTARGDFDYRTFPKPFKQSRIEITDKLIERVVPAILATTTEIKPAGSLIEQFVAINSELRKKNAATIQGLVAQTSPELLWQGVPFFPFTNSATEAAFADQRTYIYQGKEVDKQTHLGFDLASFAGTPIVASNRGKVLYAADLGIYGNCVIIDHGMGVQSLYGHLSSIGVQVGAMVEKGQQIGKSGMSGLAAGDHLHFTMLVNGVMVNPIEWWDGHWIQDRVLRKLKGQQ